MNSLIGALPILTVALGALLLMLSEALGKPTIVVTESGQCDERSERTPEAGVLAGVVLLAGACVSAGVGLAGANYVDATALMPYFAADGFTWVMSSVICVVAAFAAFAGDSYLVEHRSDRSELFPLLLWVTVGAMALVSSSDLLSLFLALETMSFGTYCLVALRRTGRALEAALKYFLLGSFASALLLFGAAFLYGATGHTDFAGIARVTATVGQGVEGALVLFGVVLVLSGLLFKTAVVPFHAWAVDAYEGAPTVVTAFMASAVKVAAIGVLLRVLLVAFGERVLNNWGTGWPPILATLAVITMVFANVVAARQSSVKRMLAYSSIAHVGYVLVGVVATLRSANAVSAVVFYLAVYAFATCGGFVALMYTSSYQRETKSYEDLTGLGRRHPAIALAFSIFLLSLAGFPPFGGFFGRLYLFQTAIEAELTVLVVIAILNSLVSAYCYLKVIFYMYMREPSPSAPQAVPMRAPALTWVLVLAAMLVLWSGVLPRPFVAIATAATFVK